MNYHKVEVREMKKHLEHGEIKLLAKKTGISHRRAYALLQGTRRITDGDIQFINACYDRALPRKQALDKLKSFA